MSMALRAKAAKRLLHENQTILEKNNIAKEVSTVVQIHDKMLVEDAASSVMR